MKKLITIFFVLMLTLPFVYSATYLSIGYDEEFEGAADQNESVEQPQTEPDIVDLELEPVSTDSGSSGLSVLLVILGLIVILGIGYAFFKRKD